jgi:hypothetical protein
MAMGSFTLRLEKRAITNKDAAYKSQKPKGIKELHEQRKF